LAGVTKNRHNNSQTACDSAASSIVPNSDQPVTQVTTYTTTNKQTQQTKSHALHGIQNRDPNNQAAADITHGQRSAGNVHCPTEFM